MDTSIFSELNWLAILVSTLAVFAAGSLWYSKLLFVKPWMRHIKVDPNAPGARDGLGLILITAIVLSFVLSFGMAILREKIGITGALSGLKLGALTGICFGITAVSMSYIFEKRPTGLHFINGGYTLVCNLIAGVIICWWS